MTPYRKLTAAIVEFATQARRIADALTTPPVVHVIVEEMPDDDVSTTPVDDLTRDQLAKELARIRRALDPDDAAYIRETVDDQLALRAKVEEATATLRRVRSMLRSLKEQGATGRTYHQAITDALAGPRPDALTTADDGRAVLDQPAVEEQPDFVGTYANPDIIGKGE